jgi:hypothetical protein
MIITKCHSVESSNTRFGKPTSVCSLEQVVKDMPTLRHQEIVIYGLCVIGKKEAQLNCHSRKEKFQ